MDEDLKITVRIGSNFYTVAFDNDHPYRDAALEEIETLKEQAINAAQAIDSYIALMPESKG